MMNGVKSVYPLANVIPVWVPLSSGTSAAVNAVVIAPPPTKLMAQYWPAGTAVLVGTICAPASPKDCLSMLFVIGVGYRVEGSGSSGKPVKYAVCVGLG